MRSLNVAIYGLGRIGRMFLRSYLESDEMDYKITHINDLMSGHTAEHLVNFDSMHGRLSQGVEFKSGELHTHKGKINYTSHDTPEEVKWGVNNIDIVVDASGMAVSSGWCQRHLDSGCDRVIASTIINDAEITVVYGVNEQDINKQHKILSNASCTSNCVIPILWVLEEAFGIEYGNITSIHAYTSNQNIIDGDHQDLYRSRCVALSAIPSTTNASKAITEILPSLSDKIHCTSVRIPTVNVSMVDCTFLLNKNVSNLDINNAFEIQSRKKLKGILSVNSKKLVSIDYNHDHHSCVIDLPQTHIIDKKFCRVTAWYDNEWAYACRISDLIQYLNKQESCYVKNSKENEKLL